MRKLPTAGTVHCTDSLGGSFGRGAFEGGAAEDGRGHPGSAGAAPQGVGEEGDAVAVEADAAEFAGHAVHEDVGALGGPEARQGTCGGGKARPGRGFGRRWCRPSVVASHQRRRMRCSLRGVRRFRVEAGGRGPRRDLMPAPWARPSELVDPVGGDGLDAGALPAGPLQGLFSRKAAVGGALHGFGELEADEVTKALAVLEAEVSR